MDHFGELCSLSIPFSSGRKVFQLIDKTCLSFAAKRNYSTNASVTAKKPNFPERFRKESEYAETPC